MLLKVTDEAFNVHLQRLAFHIWNSMSLEDLLKLQLSIDLLRLQATTMKRAFRAVCIQQDFNHKYRMLTSSKTKEVSNSSEIPRA